MKPGLQALRPYHARRYLSASVSRIVDFARTSLEFLELHIRAVKFEDLKLKGQGVLALCTFAIVMLSGIVGHLSGQHSVRQSIASLPSPAKENEEMDVLVLATYQADSIAQDKLPGSRLPARSTLSLPSDTASSGSGAGQTIQRASMVADSGRDLDTASLNWLAQELASAKAEIARLNALGQKLTVLAEMDDGEFEFACTTSDHTVEQSDQLPNQQTDQLPGQTNPSIQGQSPDSSSLGSSLDSRSGSSILPDFDAINDEVALLFPGIDHIDRQLKTVEAIFSERRSHNRAWPSGLPLFGATKTSISSVYGPRSRKGKVKFHSGLDLAASQGSAVLAMASGVVSFSGTNGDYGNLIEIEHGNGYTTRYGHNRQNLVEVGHMVRRGQMIARVGSTGKSTGPHLHVEVRRAGKSMDPLRFIALP